MNAFMYSHQAPVRAQSFHSRAHLSLMKQYDASSDPEVCCDVCGRYLGKDSSGWWDDYVCTSCHTHAQYRVLAKESA